jgi:hypothetical protein
MEPKPNAVCLGRQYRYASRLLAEKMLAVAAAECAMAGLDEMTARALLTQAVVVAQSKLLLECAARTAAVN